MTEPASDLPLRRAGLLLLGIGGPAAVLAAVVEPSAAASAASQVWPPFVLVTGLLLLGQAAQADGLFAVAGTLVSRAARRGPSLFVAGALLVAAVTAVLNLDTAVVFLTPVAVLAARRRGLDETPFLYLVVLMANGASLLLPGSNLTNLIVLDHGRRGGHGFVSGEAFAARMLPVWVVVVVVITVLLLLCFRSSLAAPLGDTPDRPKAGGWLSLVGILIAVVAMLTASAGVAAVVVAGTGAASMVVLNIRRQLTLAQVRRTVDLPVVLGLLGLAVALGATGRVWSAPAHLMAHAPAWQAAGVGATASVLMNNLPAASLLAAHSVAQPYGLLVGLDLGPNLAVTGSLSAVLWLQAARSVGARPSAICFSRLGLLVTPVAVGLALAVLALRG